MKDESNPEKKKSGRGSSPNSRKNLIPIPKGVVMNPDGARAHDPLKKAWKQLTNQTLKEIIEAALSGTLEDLAKIYNDPETPALQKGLAKFAYNAVKDGKWDDLEKLLNRTAGKVPDKIDHTTNGQPISDPGVRVIFVKPGQK